MKLGRTNASGGGSIEHNDTLNKNINPDFLHITETEKTNFVNASDFVEDFISNATDILYADLLALINNNELIPGSSYRITNYTTTTVQADTQSAGHDFDIIVTALSTNKLSENASAVQHDGDTYFENAKLESWELKYCLDNDTNRFAWALNRIIISDDSYERSKSNDKTISEIDYYAWIDVQDPEVFYYTLSEYPKIGDVIYDGDGNLTGSVIGNVMLGKGVIYYMKDEWGNECPYDFKNIQFVRKLTDGYLDEDNGVSTHVYTFTWFDEDNVVKDLSLIGNELTNDEGYKPGFFNNTIKETTSYSVYFEINTPLFVLGDNVFLFQHSYTDGFFKGCFNNSFGVNCYSNTFGNGCYSNTFGDNCYSNTFGNSFYSNTFGDYCFYNTFGNNCQSNTFGNGCGSNTFGNTCQSNTFGNDCSYNTFGDSFNTNTFGESCYSNNFYHGLSGTVIKNYIRNVVLENGVCSNNFYSELTTSNQFYLQRIKISGLDNDTTTDTTITLSATNTKYEWLICYTSGNVLKQYCPNG